MDFSKTWHECKVQAEIFAGILPYRVKRRVVPGPKTKAKVSDGPDPASCCLFLILHL